MGLVDKIKSLTKYSRPVHNRDQFKEMYLEGLVQSKELQPYFFDENGERRNDDESKQCFDRLTKMIDSNYDKYGKKNYENKGFLRKWVAKPLRMLGAGLTSLSYFIGDFLLQPAAAAYTLAPAIGMMAAADLVEGASYLYHNHSGYDLLQTPKIIAEGIAEKAAVIVGGFAIPIAGAGTITPGIEAALGNTKFDRAVAKKILYSTKNEFIKKFGEYKAPEEYKEPENIIKADFTPQPKEYKKSA